MIGIETIFLSLEGVRRGWRLGSWLASVIDGKGGCYVREGGEFLEQFYETHNKVCLDEALRNFNKVDSNDKKYIVASALYFQAICYIFKEQFDLAKRCLDKLDNIETTILTHKRALVDDIKNQVTEVRNIIDKLQVEEYMLPNTNDNQKLIGQGNVEKGTIETKIEDIISKLEDLHKSVNDMSNTQIDIATKICETQSSIIKHQTELFQAIKTEIDEDRESNKKNRNIMFDKIRFVISSAKIEIDTNIDTNKKIVIWILCIVILQLILFTILLFRI